MKAYEFPGKVSAERKLEVPEEVTKLLSDNEAVRVMIFVEEAGDATEQADWERLAAEQFLAGYSGADAIYDQI